MYSGWIVKWKLNRPLTQQERDSALPSSRQEGIKADNHATVVAFNSTYAEFVGRRFLLRGGFKTFGSTLALMLYVAVPIIFFFVFSEWAKYYRTFDCFDYSRGFRIGSHRQNLESRFFHPHLLSHPLQPRDATGLRIS